MDEREINARWAAPNEARTEGLSKLDGFSWEESERYDALERQEANLLEIMDIRRLRPHEEQRLREIQSELREMTEAVLQRKSPTPVATAAAA